MYLNFKDIARKDCTLREYQQCAKNDIFLKWDSCDNVLFQMPTGTGKTRLFTSIINDIKIWNTLHHEDNKILIIAHRIELIEQISKNLERYKIQHGIIAGGIKREYNHSVQVASIQTISHHTNISAIQDLNVKFIIIDEAHHAIANSYVKLWELFPNAKKLGVTATPWRMNGMGYKSIFDCLIVSKPIKSFIREGWLSSYTYYSISSESFENKKIKAITQFDIDGDYKTSILEKEMDISQIRAKLLDSYLKYAKGKKGIIYSISRSHSEHICEEYRKAGISIVSIDSKTPRDERRLFVSRFRQGKIDIIVNVDIFSEGFDCPDIEFIQLARPTKSLVKYLQQVGRGLRPVSGKDGCIILDNVGSHLRFGLPDADRNWDESFEGTFKEGIGRSPRESVEKQTVSHNYSEGDDTLSLIQSDFCSTEQAKPDTQNKVWQTTDDDLLKKLYIDKNCPTPLLAEVFGITEDEIKNHIKNISLDDL